MKTFAEIRAAYVKAYPHLDSIRHGGNPAKAFAQAATILAAPAGVTPSEVNALCKLSEWPNYDEARFDWHAAFTNAFKASGRTVKDAAAAIDVPLRTFEDWLYGISAPRAYMRQSVLDALGDDRRRL